MKRHEFWRQQYRLRRYMERLKEGDLQRRAKDIINNLTLLNEESKISPPPLSIETGTKRGTGLKLRVSILSGEL